MYNHGDCKIASAPFMKVNGTNCTDKKIIANSFNKYFTGVVSRLYEAIGFNVQKLSPTSASSHYYSTHSFKFERVSENDVKTKLRNLKTGKTSGLDDIPARLLKDSSNIVASPLTKIINTSLTQGIFPSDWKCARVIPLFKKGKSDEMDNYRPISVLPTVSKIMEKIIHAQFSKYLTNHHLLTPYQCGF